MVNVLNLILVSLYLALPGVFANMAPVLMKKVSFLSVPVDFGKKWKGKRIFGAHKTYRGLFFGVLFSMLVVWVQSLLYSLPFFREFSLLDYSNFLLFGFLIGIGVMLGDLIESGIKRRLGIKPGGKFFPWDQLDHVIGALVFMLPVFVPPIEIIVTMVILALVLHLLIKNIGYWIGIEDTRW